MKRLLIMLIAALVLLQALPQVERFLSSGTRAPVAQQLPGRDSVPRQIQTTPRSENASRYSCDGRQYCSQMSSCEEAKYFLRNCPDTKMDGNHDGVPCELQWCR